jgi:hypothetical protein
MNLETTYTEVLKRLKKINFSSLYPSFKQYDFALYNRRNVYINGKTIDKTQEFLANTAIQYNGDYIAIWNLQDDMDLDVLSSKIVHEMFHAHQMNQNDQRFPNDLDALYIYDYNLENLSIKYEEHKLIISLLSDFSFNRYQKLLSFRKKRALDFPKETDYEMKVEEIEGTANYVELEVLKRLSYQKFEQKYKQMINRIMDIHSFIPIRIISYDIGALLLKIVFENVKDIDLSFDLLPFSSKLIENIQPYKHEVNLEESIQEVLTEYEYETKTTIEKALVQNDVVAEGTFDLMGVNIYNAKYLKPYIISTFFVMYSDNGEKVIKQGNFVIELHENHKIKRIYKYV